MAQKTINLFLSTLSSDETKQKYQEHLDRFKQFTDGEMPMVPPNTSEQVEDLIGAYLTHMKEEEGLSYGYRGQALYAIEHWYNTMQRRVVFNWKYVSKFLGEVTFDNQIRAPTREEIQKMLAVLEEGRPKYDALIKTAASSGMRRKSLCTITRNDLREITAGGYTFYMIRLYNGSKKHQHICFVTPEAKAAIDLHIVANHIDSMNEPIFKFANPKNLSNALRDLQLRSGVGQEHIKKEGEKRGQARNEIPSVHGFKKFCLEAMTLAGVNIEAQKVMTDQAIGVRKHYVDYWNSPALAQKLIEEYVKAIPNLTIMSQIIAEDDRDKEIAMLKEQLEASLAAREREVAENKAARERIEAAFEKSKREREKIMATHEKILAALEKSGVKIE